jgi:hypothetical protein
MGIIGHLNITSEQCWHQTRNEFTKASCNARFSCSMNYDMSETDPAQGAVQMRQLVRTMPLMLICGVIGGLFSKVTSLTAAVAQHDIIAKVTRTERVEIMDHRGRVAAVLEVSAGDMPSLTMTTVAGQKLILNPTMLHMDYGEHRSAMLSPSTLLLEASKNGVAIGPRVPLTLDEISIAITSPRTGGATLTGDLMSFRDQSNRVVALLPDDLRRALRR